ncbi:hypothetical protein SAMN04488127_0812 [Bhargavaea ginsengi]|uniref:SGNH/GDSL hydrolase family protein n=2 Tax=Bhargavaea ginsengi TaxID=426757 RepID=A0A1H6UKC2_9BACL|nr:hypothetical protein SAMN04488127_0812 [Bhargavaea ginsengi]
MVFSYMSYQEKLDAAAKAESEPMEDIPENESGSEEPAEEPTIDQAQLDALTANASPKVREVLNARLKAGDDARMVVIGSADIQGVADRLANAVHDAYGGFLSVDAFAYDGTSTEFVTDGMQHLAWTNEYDIVVYEPFTLNNNGVVTIEDEQQHLLQVEERAMEAVPDVAFLVTPPQPIRNAGYYQTQIDNLKTFTEQQNMPYIDHWTKWPVRTSEEINNYLDASDRPTDQGLDLWASALIEYFVAK